MSTGKRAAVSTDPDRRRLRVVAGTILLSVHQFTEAAVPVLIGLTIDRAIAPSDPGALLACVGGLVALFVLLLLCWRHGARCMEYATLTEAHRLRTAVVAKALDPRGRHGSHASGELVSIANTDADRASTVIEARMLCIAAIAGIASATALLLTINVWVGVVVLVGSPLVMLLVHMLAGIIARRSERAQDAIARAAALAFDLTRGLRALRGVGAARTASDRYREASAAARESAIHSAKPMALQAGLGVALGGLFLAAVVAVAVPLTIDGAMTIGALIGVVGLAQFVSEPLATLISTSRTLAIARGSARRVDVALTRPSTALPVTHAPRTGAGFQSLRIEADLDDAGVVEIHVDDAEIVGVVTDDPRDADAIRRAVAELRDRTARSLDGDRAVVHLEPHHVELFEGTLGHNLLAMPGDEHDVVPSAVGVSAALTDSAADELVDGHTAGLGRMLVDRGANLSGGQRQRLALARALVADPALLVLTDPTTSVDAATEARIADGIAHARTRPGRGTLLMTNSPALLARTHRVIGVIGGALETGTHAELLHTSRDYRTAVLR